MPWPGFGSYDPAKTAVPKFRTYGRWYFLGALALVTFFIWQAAFWVEARRGRVIMHFFDVGQGDATLIEAPNGNQVLIDGGPDQRILEKLGKTLPFWDQSLDLVILTHPHADHLDGLVEVAKRYRVGMVLESGVNHTIPEYGEWHQLLEANGVRIVTAQAGQRVRLSPSVSLEVLAPVRRFTGRSPRDIHDAMVVMKFIYASTAALLMGDAERSLERELIASGADLDVDLLKAGHHGSKTSTSEEFLRATTPEAAVISAGRRNRYGHPHPEVLERLVRFGIRVHRTDQDGDMTAVSDGKTLSY